jgi:hypothetical protein
VLQRRFDLANITSTELVKKYLADKVYAVTRTNAYYYAITFKINGETDNLPLYNKFQLATKAFNKFIESKAIIVTAKQPDNVVIPKK